MANTNLLLALGFLEKLILLFLVGLSVYSISLIWGRMQKFKAIDEADSFEDAKSKILSRDKGVLTAWITGHAQGMRAQTARIALDASEQAQSIEQVDRATKAFLNTEKTKLEKGLTALATLGSNAPFIGLFGTVLGIIQAFGLLSTQKSDTNALMASISVALIATAAGLFVAIPAVIAYNTYNRKLKVLLIECETLRDLIIAHFFRGKN